MSHTKIAPIDVVSGARAVETLLKKKDGFSFKASTKTREPFCFTRIYDNLAIKIMAILPVMHDEHGILHVTGNKILLCVRKTIATTPKNSDGVLLSFRPMQMTDNWPKRLATFLHALHLLCAWKICCKKDGARMIPGTYKGRVVYTHAHADGTITRQDVPSHIAVEQINKRLFQKS